MTIARDHRRLHRPRGPRVPAAARLVVAAEGRRQDPRRRPGARRRSSRARPASCREAVRDLAQGRQQERRRRAARAAPSADLARDRAARQPGLRVGRGGGGRAPAARADSATSTPLRSRPADDAAVAARPERIVVAGGDGSVGCAAAAAGAGRRAARRRPGRHRQRLRPGPGAAADARRGGRRSPPPELGRARLDLGRVGERPFVNAASAGLSPVAARKAHGLKRALGPLAYTVGALRAGPVRASRSRCAVRVDGEASVRRARPGR